MVKEIRLAVEQFRLETTRCLHSTDELVAERFIKNALDPWQNLVLINWDGAGVAVSSRGADGRKGTADDIVSGRSPAKP